MKTQTFSIEHIPAMLWGSESDTCILAIHGSQSHKADTVVEIFATHANIQGYQVLSFDLPEHGERKEDPALCKVQVCIPELQMILQYAKTRWKRIGIFANSIGAYFSLLTFSKEPLWQAWFLSPIVDMQRLIEHMMHAFHITEKELLDRQVIPTPIQQTLYWDYYAYVRQHPILHWPIPTNILYGAEDELCDWETIAAFTKKFSCHLQVVEHAAHYFHSEYELAHLHTWMIDTLIQKNDCA